jgi:putative DNA primase/helicase
MELSFESFAEQHGLIIDHVVHDRWVRVPTTDKPQSKNGAYIWDGRSGAIQNWAVHEKPISYLSKNEFVPDPKYYEKKRQAEEKRKKKNHWAIKTAKDLLDNSIKKSHPYMAKKGFPDFKVPVFTAGSIFPELAKHDGCMILPMRIGDKLVGCQTISADGEKKFLYGQITKEAELVIDNKGRHILCEGYATAMSVRKALQSLRKHYTIHVCFSASNILQIASKYDNCIIVADHDPVGIQTAKKTGKLYWLSPLAGEDFNDYEVRVGAIEAGKSLIAIGLRVTS